jgi:glycosyltransferase involved in cell wall biosynthesis
VVKELNIMTIKASVLLLTQNNEKSIVRCLDTLKDFSEVVIIDGGSKDKTIEIAKGYSNVVVHENPWPGFIEQRNVSIERASEKWCFMIDSDEASTPELNKEIARIVEANNDNIPMYRAMRTEFYLGETIETGFGRSNWQERLFIKDRVQYTGGVHHQHLIDGKHQNEQQALIKNLDPAARVLHDESYGLIDWMTKLPRFALLRADEKYNPNRNIGKLDVFIAFIGTFFQILYQCRKQPKTAFIIAMQTAIFRCLVKLRLYERQHIGFDDKEASKTRHLG